MALLVRVVRQESAREVLGLPEYLGAFIERVFALAVVIGHRVVQVVLFSQLLHDTEVLASGRGLAYDSALTLLHLGVHHDALAGGPVVHPELLVLAEQLVLLLLCLLEVLLQLVLVAHDDVLLGVPLGPLLLVFEQHIALLLLALLQLALDLLDLVFQHAPLPVQHFLVLHHLPVPLVLQALDLLQVLLLLLHQVVDLLLVLGQTPDFALGLEHQLLVQLLHLLVQSLDPVFVVRHLLVVVVLNVPDTQFVLVLLLLLHLIDGVFEGLTVLTVHLGRQVLQRHLELLLVLLQLLLELGVLLVQELLLVLP